MRRLLATLLALLVAACAGPDGAASPAPAPPPMPQGVAMAENAGPRADVSAADRAELVVANNAFALDLYRALAGDDNLIFSSSSIGLALAMTFAGARGDTATEMAEVLHLMLPPEIYHAAMGELIETLTAEPAETDEHEGDPFALEIANSSWAQGGYPFREEFLGVLATNYGAGVNLVDFITGAAEAQAAINDWADEATQGRVTDLIPDGALDDMTRLVLANAIWFRGAWVEEFSPEATAPRPFTLLDGSVVDVPTMTGSVDGATYIAEDGYQAVSLPYVGGASMVVIVPDAGRFQEVATAIDAESLRRAAEVGQTGTVRIALPTFEVRSDLPLVDVLRDLGMPTAFEPPVTGGGADFTGMTEIRELYASDVFHQAFITVDEVGTEAAAATAVVMKAVSGPMEVGEVEVDRPFLFAILHDATGQILFMGHVTDPR